MWDDGVCQFFGSCTRVLLAGGLGGVVAIGAFCKCLRLQELRRWAIQDLNL